jgi:hypothetical protein
MKQISSETQTADANLEPTQASTVQHPQQAVYVKPNLETHAEYRVLIGGGGTI